MKSRRGFASLQSAHSGFISDVIKTFFQDQDLNFKTKLSVQDQDQDFAFQDQDQDLFVMYTRGRPKSIFIFGRKRKCRQK